MIWFDIKKVFLIKELRENIVKDRLFIFEIKKLKRYVYKKNILKI